MRNYSIFKFVLPYPISNPRFSLNLPWMHTILDCQIQMGVPVLWVELDNKENTSEEYFEWLPTGQEVGILRSLEIPEDSEPYYIKTIQFSSLVYHLYCYKQYKPRHWTDYASI